jgi:hypothetical protein
VLLAVGVVPSNRPAGHAERRDHFSVIHQPIIEPLFGYGNSQRACLSGCIAGRIAFLVTQFAFLVRQ